MTEQTPLSEMILRRLYNAPPTWTELKAWAEDAAFLERQLAEVRCELDAVISVAQRRQSGQAADSPPPGNAIYCGQVLVEGIFHALEDKLAETQKVAGMLAEELREASWKVDADLGIESGYTLCHSVALATFEALEKGATGAKENPS